MSENLPAAPAPLTRPTNSQLSPADHWDHILARIGWRRGAHRVAPGLYSLGSPTPQSPVFITGNYTLSFDALRSALPGVDAYILALDTHGINVWCAAGKGTFGTQELVKRVSENNLAETVTHRTLILPQLGAPGVSAHEIKRATGFRVEYGPVRAADLPEYLKTHKATTEMRRVRFDLIDRLTVIPVELTHILLPLLAAVIIFYFLGGWLIAGMVASAILGGVALFPILLPWIPTQAFSTKGYILGVCCVLPFFLAHLVAAPLNANGWSEGLKMLAFLLALPPVTAFIALNFTGATTFTSRTGVRREIFRYIPFLAWLFGAGILLGIVSFALPFIRG